MKALKVSAFILIQLIICVVIVESGSYLFLKNTDNPSYRAKRILQSDDQLGWKLQANLNTKFEDKKVVSDDNGFRAESSIATSGNWILTLGPSSAFGWGVESEETYTNLFSQKLQMPAFNASQIGYSVAQGDRLFQQLLKGMEKPPQYLIISYGVNDLDKFRFYTDNYLPDRVYFDRSLNFPLLFKLAPYSNFINLLTLFADESRLKYNCQQLGSINQRVSPEDFMEYTDKIISEAERLSMKPIIINTPYYLKTKNPDYSLAKIQELYHAVEKTAQQGNCKEALELLAQAKSLEPDRVTEDVQTLNADLENYAAGKGLPYVNAYKLLNTDTIAQNYVDPIHPSAIGHKLIADEISEQLRIKQ